MLMLKVVSLTKKAKLISPLSVILISLDNIQETKLPFVETETFAS